MNTTVPPHDIHRLLHAEHDDPFGALGLHQTDNIWVLRSFRPDAKELSIVDRHHAGLPIARHGDGHGVPQIQRCRGDSVVGKACVSLLARGDGHLAFGECREPNHFLGKFLCFVACQHGISP